MAITKKTPAKATKKTPAKTKVALQKATVRVESGLSVPVVGADGKAKGKMTLPKEFFDVAVNKKLLAQAVRVFLANQRVGNSSTKTRGEVEGSTRKIYRQKGTGRARHGAIRAPIFVGGGIVFGPKPRDYRLTMTAKMKKVALAGALTDKLRARQIIVVDGFDSLKPKTKLFAAAFAAVGGGKHTLFVVSKDAANLTRATRNIATVESMVVENLHPYAVLAHDKVVFTKEALKHYES